MGLHLPLHVRGSGTALIIGCTAGFTGASTIIAAKLAGDPGDVLGLIGGAIGAGFAVIGALWVEGRKSAAQREVLAQTLLGVAASAMKLPLVPEEHVCRGPSVIEAGDRHISGREGADTL